MWKKSFLLFSSLTALCFISAIVIDGCDTQQSTSTNIDGESVVFTSSMFNPNDDSPYGSITLDSLYTLTKNAMQEDLKNRQYSTATGWQLYVNVPRQYSQIDGRWSSKPLGYNACQNSTIGRYGCFLCCICMWYSTVFAPPVYPDALSSWSFRGLSHFAFAKDIDCGDLIRLPEAQYYPGYGPFNTNYQYISYDNIYKALQKGYPVVVKVNYGAGFHYMLIYGFDGARYWVYDPLRSPGNQSTPLYNTVKAAIVLGAKPF